MTKSELRKFGLLVGAAFVAIAAVSYWRGGRIWPYTGGLGGLLIVGGLVAPTALGPVYRAWMGLAHLLSKVTTPIFMGVVYFVAMTPIALVMRLFGHRSLVHRAENNSYWSDRTGPVPEPNQMRRQF